SSSGALRDLPSFPTRRSSDMPCGPATSRRHFAISLPPDKRSRATAPLPAHSAPGERYQSHISPPFPESATAHDDALPAPHADGWWLPDPRLFPDETGDRQIAVRVHVPDN